MLPFLVSLALAQAPSGAAVFDNHCAACHAGTDTKRDFDTVNGVPPKGASISGPGPVVAGGMVYVSSGCGALGGRPGNVLLAFGE
jgi:mono/diheme cytochrome c family protein